MQQIQSRRDMLKISLKSIAATCATAGVWSLFSSCRNQQKFSNSDGDDVKSIDASVKNFEEASLTDQEKSIRSSLKYVDSTPIPTRTCDNCKLYTLPRDSVYGGCKVVPGPIHARGYCTAWLHRM